MIGVFEIFYCFRNRRNEKQAIQSEVNLKFPIRWDRLHKLVFSVSHSWPKKRRLSNEKWLLFLLPFVLYSFLTDDSPRVDNNYNNNELWPKIVNLFYLFHTLDRKNEDYQMRNNLSLHPFVFYSFLTDVQPTSGQRLHNNELWPKIVLHKRERSHWHS